MTFKGSPSPAGNVPFTYYSNGQPGTQRTLVPVPTVNMSPPAAAGSVYPPSALFEMDAADPSTLEAMPLGPGIDAKVGVR